MNWKSILIAFVVAMPLYLTAQKTSVEIVLRPAISEPLQFTNNQNGIYESAPRLSGELMVLFSKPQESKDFKWKAGVKFGLTGYNLGYNYVESFLPANVTSFYDYDFFNHYDKMYAGLTGAISTNLIKNDQSRFDLQVSGSVNLIAPKAFRFGYTSIDDDGNAFRMIGGEIKANATALLFDLGVDINYWFSIGNNEFGAGAFASLGSKSNVKGRLETFGETDSFILDFEQGNSLYGLQLSFRRSR